MLAYNSEFIFAFRAFGPHAIRPKLRQGSTSEWWVFFSIGGSNEFFRFSCRALWMVKTIHLTMKQGIVEARNFEKPSSAWCNMHSEWRVFGDSLKQESTRSWQCFDWYGGPDQSRTWCLKLAKWMKQLVLYPIEVTKGWYIRTVYIYTHTLHTHIYIIHIF